LREPQFPATDQPQRVLRVAFRLAGETVEFVTDLVRGKEHRSHWPAREPACALGEPEYHYWNSGSPSDTKAALLDEVLDLLAGSLERVSELPGVGPKQFVKRVPARCVLGEQVDPGQLGEQGPDRPQRDAREVSGLRSAEVPTWMPAEQPEQPGCLAGERPVGPG
jgi:hypothetical protein